MSRCNRWTFDGGVAAYGQSGGKTRLALTPSMHGSGLDECVGSRESTSSEDADAERIVMCCILKRIDLV